MVFPHNVSVAGISHAFHYTRGDNADDLPDGARRKIRILPHQRHPAVVPNRNGNGCSRQIPVRKIELASRRPALERHLVGVRQGVDLAGLDAVIVEHFSKLYCA